MRIFLLILMFAAFACRAEAVDLRAYMPDSSQVVLSKTTGPHARYTFKKAPSGFLGLYTGLMNLNKPGHHYTWQKEYLINGAWCTKTYAILFVGDDGSVTEVGDWLAQGASCTPSVAFGYKDSSGNPTGLVWAPAGGFLSSVVFREMDVHAQAYSGAAYSNTGHKAFSKTGVVNVIPQMQIGQYVFTDVLHLVMYHGTKSPAPVPVRCNNSPVKADGVYYQSFKDYNSYAIELWLAPGIGVVKESTPFIEDAAYWGLPNCVGAIFEPSKSWVTTVESFRQP